jgi:hypothetical protein
VNRRAFLRTLVGALCGARVAKGVRTHQKPADPRSTLTYRGRPLVFAPYVPANRIYFLNPQQLRLVALNAALGAPLAHPAAG